MTTLADSPLGLRHGPLSSVDGQTLFVAFLSSELRRRGYELDLLREIDRKRLGRVRAVVTAGEVQDVASLVDYCLSLGCAADFPDLYRPVLDVMFGSRTSRAPGERLRGWARPSSYMPEVCSWPATQGAFRPRPQNGPPLH